MKRLALLLLLLPALAGAKTPDENDLLDRTLDSSSPFYYPNLMMRYNAGDATLTDAEKIARVKEVYDRLDIPRLTEQQISLRFERALATLDSLSADPARTLRMREFAEGLMGRKK